MSINRTEALANARQVLEKHLDTVPMTAFDVEVFEEVDRAWVGFVLDVRIPDTDGRPLRARAASKPGLPWEEATVLALEKQFLEGLAALYRCVAVRYDTIAEGIVL